MATIDESSSAKRWLPLEANPDVMNQVLSRFTKYSFSDHRKVKVSKTGKILLGLFSDFSSYWCVCVQFLWGLGLAPDAAECNDVFGLDDELLEMVPKPVLAVLFLYPITKKVSSLLIVIIKLNPVFDSHCLY